jgi:hypothetical protein
MSEMLLHKLSWYDPFDARKTLEDYYAYFVNCINRYGIPSIVSPVLYVSQTNLSTQPGFSLAPAFKKSLTRSTILL